MPIKFRCNYCRQFLGISRAQAGGIVDCPTCGRAIRVPMLDGTLQPLPEPELNLQDAHLARALDELAKLGIGDSQPVSVPHESEADGEEVENEIPQPIPEPIPIEVPIPPTPISINPPPQDDDEIEVPVSEHSAVDKNAANRLLNELASLAPPTPIDGQPQPKEISKPYQEPRSPLSRRQLSKNSLMIGLAFVAGMLFERFVKVLESPKPQSKPADSVEPKPVPVSHVTGRITYKTSDGTSQADRGARIIAFPLQREGEAKLSVVGFRPADGQADARIAAAALQALGGGLTTTDEAGQFRLDIPAGTYQLLVLSHFQSRDDKEPIDPTLHKLLASYFDKPGELLGRVKYDFEPLRVKGTGDVWDHGF